MIEICGNEDMLSEIKESFIHNFNHYQSYHNLSLVWMLDYLNGCAEEYDYERENELLEPYRIIKKYEGVPMMTAEGEWKGDEMSYDFSRASVKEMITLEEELTLLRDRSRFCFIRKKYGDWTNGEIYHFFMYQYLIEEHNLLFQEYETYQNSDKTNCSAEEFVEKCEVYKEKRDISGGKMKADIMKRLEELSELEIGIIKMEEKYEYSTWAENAIIECIAVPVPQRYGYYPFKTIKKVKEYALQEEGKVRNGKSEKSERRPTRNIRKLLYQWKVHKGFEYSVFSGGNQRLCVGETSVRDIEAWSHLTGSLVTNVMYQTILDIENRFWIPPIMKSRMDEKTEKALYYLVEAVNKMPFGEVWKAMFIRRMLLLLPLFVDEKNAKIHEIINVFVKKLACMNISKEKEYLESEMQKEYSAEQRLELGKISDEIQQRDKEFVKVYGHIQVGNSKSAKKGMDKSKEANFFELLSKANLFVRYYKKSQ